MLPRDMEKGKRHSTVFTRIQPEVRSLDHQVLIQASGAETATGIFVREVADASPKTSLADDEHYESNLFHCVKLISQRSRFVLLENALVSSNITWFT
jgi:hypothetical protein